MDIIYPVSFVLFESIWRRWFGGGFDYKWLEWINYRFLKHCINLAALFCVCYFYRELSWQWSAYVACVVQFLFWTLTFGMYFDIGRGGKPVTEEDIKDYNKPWFAPFLNWCFPGESRYTPFYDFCGMAIRFTWPLLLLVFVPGFHLGIAVLGELVALYYGIGWVMYEYGDLKKIGPTELGEFASGATTGLFLTTLGL